MPAGELRDGPRWSPTPRPGPRARSAPGPEALGGGRRPGRGRRRPGAGAAACAAYCAGAERTRPATQDPAAAAGLTRKRPCGSGAESSPAPCHRARGRPPAREPGRSPGEGSRWRVSVLGGPPSRPHPHPRRPSPPPGTRVGPSSWFRATALSHPGRPLAGDHPACMGDRGRHRCLTSPRPFAANFLTHKADALLGRDEGHKNVLFLRKAKEGPTPPKRFLPSGGPYCKALRREVR